MRVALLLLLCLPVACLKTGSRNGKPTAPEILGEVGEFALTERSGKTVTNRDLEGNVWIATFVFTRCTESCPQVSGTVARLQKEFASEAGLKFVTFTVDPTRDDPQELKKYAERYRADPERWLFLTGDEAKIKALLDGQFHAGIIRNPNARTEGQEFDHSSKMAVVDRRGNIRGYFDGMRRSKVADPEKEFEEEMQKLKKCLQLLLAETP